jgi:hypothetical protein
MPPVFSQVMARIPKKRCPRPSQDRELSLTMLADKPLPKISEDRATELSGLNVKSVIQAVASARRRHRPPIPGFPSD